MKYRNLIRATLIVALLGYGIVPAIHAAPLTWINTTLANPSLTSVLDAAYGAGNYERVSDDLDDVWTSEDLLGATAIGKYAAAKQQLGICVLCDGSDNVLIGPAIAQGGALSVVLFDETFDLGGPSFRWFDAAFGAAAVATVYSDPLLNPRSVDQMVTYAIKDRPGVFVLAFEDRPSGIPFIASDRDFNDFIVEVRFTVQQPEPPVFPKDPLPPPNDETISAVPEPSSMALLGGALLAVGLVRRNRRPRA